MDYPEFISFVAHAAAVDRDRAERAVRDAIGAAEFHDVTAQLPPEYDVLWVD